jgi:hypothetical protein
MKTILSLVCAIIIFVNVNLRAGEEDPLHNRKFNTALSETRNGVVQKKVITDMVYFKHGKLRSDFIQKKFGFKWIRYRINKDTVYIDETNAEVRLLEIEASITNDINQTVILEFDVLEWDLDGILKMTKNDKLRKYFDMVGREKGGKPKKIKKKKEDRKPDSHRIHFKFESDDLI